MWTTNFYKSFSKNIWLFMSSRLSKIRSVRTRMLCPGRFILVESVRTFSPEEYRSGRFYVSISSSPSSPTFSSTVKPDFSGIFGQQDFFPLLRTVARIWITLVSRISVQARICVQGGILTKIK